MPRPPASPRPLPGATDLPALLRAEAARRPEQPHLFFRRSADWRWCSWGQVATAVDALAVALHCAASEAGLPPGARVGYLYQATPDHVSLDLALQAAGLAVTPLPAEGTAAAEALTDRDCRALAHFAAGDDPDETAVTTRAAEEAGIPIWELPLPRLAVPKRPEWRPPPPPPVKPLPSHPAGPVVVTDAAGHREIPHSALLAAAALLASRLPPRRTRDIVVSTYSPADPIHRLLLSWSLSSAAALALEPEPIYLVSSAIWVRPTLFAGTQPERDSLRSWLAAHDRPRNLLRHPRLPLGRLDTVLATDSTPIPDEERTYWTSRGVTLLSLLSVL